MQLSDSPFIAVESGFEVVDDRHHTSPIRGEFPRHIQCTTPFTGTQHSDRSDLHRAPAQLSFVRFYTRYLSPGNRDAADENEWSTMLRLQWFAWLLPGGFWRRKEGRGKGGGEQNMPVAVVEKEHRERRKKTVVAEDGTCRVRWFRSSAPEIVGMGERRMAMERKEVMGEALVVAAADGIWLPGFWRTRGITPIHLAYISPHTQRSSSRRLHTSVYPVLSPPSYHRHPRGVVAPGVAVFFLLSVVVLALSSRATMSWKFLFFFLPTYHTSHPFFIHPPPLGTPQENGTHHTFPVGFFFLTATNGCSKMKDDDTKRITKSFLYGTVE